MEWINHVRTSTYRQYSKRSTARPPTLEPLEDRQLLSTCHVTRLSDAGIGMGFRGDLRYCINKVNTNPGADIIDFHVTGTINLTAALPDLASDIDVQGPGAGQLTIDGQQKTRLFKIDAIAHIEISGLTLKNGKDVNKQNGGGIYNDGGLVLRDSVLTGNFGFGKGGAIYNTGTLLITSSIISMNNLDSAPGCCNNFAGGIYNAANASLLLQGSELTGNSISGGISHRGYGGGLANFGNAVVIGTTISDNHAISYGGWGGAGGGIFNSGELHVDSSLIAQNETLGDFYALGGGICNGLDPWESNPIFPGGIVTIVSSTITDNVASARGDDPLFGEALGGGINTENGGSVTLVHSTVADNFSDGEQPQTAGRGGGIAITNSSLQIRNTILANNAAKSSGQDITGTLASSGYNIFENSSGGSGYSSTDLLDVNPLLGPLADNGGPTLTKALLPGSPAIDAGDNTDAPEWDQRGPGFPRIVNGTIDIGAFEVQSSPIPPATRPGFDLLAVVLATVDFDSLT